MSVVRFACFCTMMMGALLLTAACGSSSDCTPSPVFRNLMNVEESIAAGEEILHVADKPSDANLIYIGLDWEGDAVLQMSTTSVGCVCGVCELWQSDPQYSEIGLDDFRLILAGDFSCTDAFDITIVGDPEIPVDYRLMVLYETAGCPT